MTSLAVGFPSANISAMKLMPLEIQYNQLVNPDAATLKRAQIQTDVDSALPLYEKYWELLKIGS